MVNEDDKNYVNLCPNSKIKLLRPPISFIVDKVVNKDYFRFVKLNHTYWEMRAKLEPWYSRFIKIHGMPFLNETAEIIKNLPNDFLLSIGIESLTGAQPSFPFILESLIETSVPLGKPLYYGPLWKYYTATKQIHSVIRHFRKMHVVVVGFNHLAQLKKSWGISKFHFIEITVNDATPRKDEIVQRIKNIRNTVNGDMVCLFQAGELLSLWLIYNLRDLESAYLIDMGRAIDAWVDLYLTNQNKVAAVYFPDLVGNNQPWKAALEKPVLTYTDIPML